MAAGAAAIAGFLLLPAEGSAAASVTLIVIGLIAALALIFAVRLHRPERPAMWYLFAGGMIMNVLGDTTFEYYKIILEQEPYPSFADAFYLASYPMYATGLVLLLFRRRLRELSTLIDAAIIATGLGLVFWIFILRPTAAEEATSAFESWVSTTYPAVDVLLLVLLARLFADSGARSVSIRLIGAAVLLTLVADTSFSLASLYELGYEHPINGVFLLSYVAWVAAALHPSMAAPPSAVVPAPSGGTHRRTWLGVFGLCSLLAPTLLFVPGVGDDRTDRAAVAIASIVLFVLVIARLAGYMSKVRHQSAELERLALADDLTGLANRRRFESALRDVLAAGSLPQVALLGVNGFKNVNDELGRPVGDRVLAALAGRIANAAPHALVARLGGDEFAVLLTGASAHDARELADTLVAGLHLPVLAGDRELLVGASIGLAGGAVDPAELVRQAETAMHAAKRTGAAAVRWSPALDERATDAARLGAELRAALDASQFRVVYQPIVELPLGRVKAVEALVRWEHPYRGLVSPAAFIPVAEQNGLIVELGDWIMRTACRRLARWRAELGPAAPERVSVNVSAKQLARPGYAATVAAILADTGLPAGCLAVEITETAVFEGGPAVVALHELRELGVRIALDDFGTGHSSLGLLQTVPVHTLKVDKSFVDNITASGRHAVIAEALIRISSGLGLSAVAEGVETAEQAAALSRLGYRYLQGYHFGRPVADPDFELVRALAAA
ncbi:putative bifunctional diguanylate cyclase/phosphodiesterase [Paractinoplanes rishiriensis]|uniref:putative bifunctional diguanylate cyclase/phosphodiesterase n=1 Tax=Paractinoplanes rishiriensis TaxID=1050105 RepID=UPI001EF3B4EC|nr:bifunctional diguanylate cyclase/phosphodiesterase [Actinoplanes rishiriensis]